MPLKKVFLCHSSSDKLFVDRLASDLEKVNIGVWYDKWEIKVGDSLIEKIQEGLNNNDYLAIILSPESLISEWVKRELNSALMKEIKEKKVIVLPCLISNCSVPAFLSEKKYADFTKSYEDGFTDLLLAIFPESKEVAIHSRDFRVIQYLISGLTNTDSFGSNILNAQQYIKVYPFRKELKNYLGLDEKRLLFYSAVAFKGANPDTPFFMNNSVPVWGLIDEVDDLIRSQWLLEGINQKIFGYIAQYFDWAITINQSINIDKVAEASIYAHKAINPSLNSTIENIQTKFHLLKLSAKYYPETFIDYHIKQSEINPWIIESTSELPEPLNINYYLNWYKNNKKPEIITSIIKTLIKLKKPVAVEILSETNKIINTDEIMNMLHSEIFEPALKKWLSECTELEDKVYILGLLGNCHAHILSELDEMLDKHEKIKGAGNVLLMRIIGCYGNKSYADFLISKFERRNSILSEAIIYALGKLLKEKCVDHLINWYNTEDSNLIRAAAIETIARFDSEFVNRELENIYSYKDNPYMLSAFIRAIEISKSVKWKDYLPQLFNHPSLLIKICAARSAAIISDDKYAMATLDSNFDNIIKSAFDEKIYCREPFRPDWLRQPHNYDIELARLTARLTWPDQPTVYFQKSLDLNRIFSRLTAVAEY